MGNQKQKWTAAEEEALLAGVAKHGPGKWKNIIKDPECAPFLIHRSNIDLKDKWRNLGVNSCGHGSKERPRATKIRKVVGTQHDIVQSPASAASVRPNASLVAVTNDALSTASDGKNAPRYDAMIFEALLTMKDKDGSTIGAILNYIEQRHEVPVPANFRRVLGTRLRQLAMQGKLDKAQNGYKIKTDVTLVAETPISTPDQKEVRLWKLQNYVPMISTETVKDAADNAAYKLVDADNKCFLATQAMKEAERVSMMAEDTDSMLLLMEEIYEQCLRGEVVALA
ncbi:hypothetical protein FF2_045794 [Malus domestica]